MNLNINAINIGGGTQCRDVIDQPLVVQYLEHMKDGDEFPDLEIMYDGATYWLVDGFHRYHAYKMLGLKVVNVSVKEGTLLEAKKAALKANSRHGKSLTFPDKRKKVLMAIEIFGEDKTNYFIAQECELSQSFVASVRNPEVAEKQKKNRDKSNENKVLQNGNTSRTSSKNETLSDLSQKNNEISEAIKDLPNGSAPDDDEIRVAELAQQADMEAMYKLLESDDALKAAHEEIKRLNQINSSLEVRMRGLMDEKNVAVKMVKDLQKQLDKLRKTK